MATTYPLPPGTPLPPIAPPAAGAAPAVAPAPPGPGGGFMRRMANPMLYAGLGMLSQGSSLTPINPWANVASGLAMGMQANAYESEERREAALLKMQRERLAAEREERKRKAAARARTESGYGELVAGLDPAVSARLGGSSALLSMGPETGMGLLSPYLAPPKPVDQWSSEEVTLPNGDKVLVQTNQATGKQQVVGGGGVNIDISGGPSETRAPTPDEITTAGLDSGEGLVVEDGKIKTAPISEQEKARISADAKAQQAYDAGSNLVADYMDKAQSFQGGMTRGAGPKWGVSADSAESARDTLVAWYATNVLGTPGTEPSPGLYARAETAVPDFAGWYDAPRFNKRMEDFMRTVTARLAAKASGSGDSDPTRVPLPDSETIPRRPAPPLPPGAVED